ncbi:MAG: hypothetical protein LH628_04900 [Microcoleus sp. CAN_BIN18]|nr:hypothetical protein [Microcoleus sp. CAN_BIN18]
MHKSLGNRLLVVSFHIAVAKALWSLNPSTLRPFDYASGRRYASVQRSASVNDRINALTTLAVAIQANCELRIAIVPHYAGKMRCAVSCRLLGIVQCTIAQKSN